MANRRPAFDIEESENGPCKQCGGPCLVGDYCGTCAQERRMGQRESAAVLVQPAPTGDGTAITPLVMRDLAERSAIGRLKYGTALRAGNGRDALTDAYQEGLDLVQYLRQALFERDGK